MRLRLELEAQGGAMRNYHVRLADGSERNIKAATVELTGGALTFKNQNGELVCMYAPVVWSAVEVERMDDKG